MHCLEKSTVEKHKLFHGGQLKIVISVALLTLIDEQYITDKRRMWCICA